MSNFSLSSHDTLSGLSARSCTATGAAVFRTLPAHEASISIKEKAIIRIIALCLYLNLKQQFQFVYMNSPPTVF